MECPCPMVKKGKNNTFLYHGTEGRTEQVFQALFGGEEHLTLKKPIAQGDADSKQNVQ